jgi:cystathionine beta-lyase
MHALIGAYSAEGRAWADELCQVLSKSAAYAYDHVVNKYHGVKMARAQATYVILLDCEQWCKEHDVTNDDLVRRGWDVGVTWHDGRLFECPWCVRLNIALPFSQIVDAFDRMDRYVFV